VAVVSISKIQIRRGQKNVGSGLPQLASGELGWAIDTQEIFIGNGSVAEGAPAVGNTKILTEKDNIFTLANAYTYDAESGNTVTGPDSSSPVKRSLQERLDDRVSVRSFGTRGDGAGDDSEALQRAIDQLFLNPATKSQAFSRVILHLEPGTYAISQTIFVPPYANIVGAGSEKTVITVTGNQPAFKTVNGFSEPGSPENFDPGEGDQTSFDNQARYIRLEGITIEHNNQSPAVVLQNCRESVFRDIKVTGTWSPGDSLDTEWTAWQLNSSSNVVETRHNLFENCRVEGYCVAVTSDWDINNCTWSNFSVSTAMFGFRLGSDISSLGAPGQTTGPSQNTIENSVFENINRQAILIENGKENTSSQNRFTNVGNNQGTEKQPVYSVIKFGNPSNSSSGDWFARTVALTRGSNLNQVPYIPEIEGSAFYRLDHEQSQTFGKLQGVKLFRLPKADCQSYEIDYVMTGLAYQFTRSGTMHVTVDTRVDEVEIADDYNYVGDSDYEDSISFSGKIRGVGAIDVRLFSDMPNDDETLIRYTIKAKNTAVN